MGIESGISKSEVSRICGQLDTDGAAGGSVSWPGGRCRAAYCKARINGRVVSRAVVIAAGVTADGQGPAGVVAAAIRTIFTQPTGPGVRDQVGIVADMPGQRFPDDAAVPRLSSCLLIETHDEWQISRRYLSEASMTALTPPAPAVLEPRHDAPQEVIDNPNLKTA